MNADQILTWHLPWQIKEALFTIHSRQSLSMRPKHRLKQKARRKAGPLHYPWAFFPPSSCPPDAWAPPCLYWPISWKRENKGVTPGGNCLSPNLYSNPTWSMHFPYVWSQGCWVKIRRKEGRPFLLWLQLKSSFCQDGRRPWAPLCEPGEMAAHQAPAEGLTGSGREAQRYFCLTMNHLHHRSLAFSNMEKWIFN